MSELLKSKLSFGAVLGGLAALLSACALVGTVAISIDHRLTVIETVLASGCCGAAKPTPK